MSTPNGSNATRTKPHFTATSRELDAFAPDACDVVERRTSGRSVRSQPLRFVVPGVAPKVRGVRFRFGQIWRTERKEGREALLTPVSTCDLTQVSRNQNVPKRSSSTAHGTHLLWHKVLGRRPMKSSVLGRPQENDRRSSQMVWFFSELHWVCCLENGPSWNRGRPTANDFMNHI